LNFDSTLNRNTSLYLESIPIFGNRIKLYKKFKVGGITFCIICVERMTLEVQNRRAQIT